MKFRPSIALLAFLCLAFACASEDEPVCGPGAARCAGVCVDPASNPAHCGGCDLACADDQRCSAGTCVDLCPEGDSLCEGECVDTAQDPDNCGACGKACPEGDENSAYTCVDRECTLSCAPGWGDCDDSGLCSTDLAFNPSHCGQCGRSCEGGTICLEGECRCPTGLVDCDGTCVDPAADPLHCGGCGNACSAGQGCSNGLCCDEGETGCGLGCFDLSADPLNCGRCGDTCLGRPNASGGSCSAGACELACEGSFLDCNLDRTDGCEADSDADPDHCGGCGQVCSLRRCEGGSCATVLQVQGQMHTCAVVSDGSLHCWGFDPFGTKLQTGGAPTNRPAVVLDPETGGQPMEGVVQVAGGFLHNCALYKDGSVRCWGAAAQRGNPDVAGSAPVRVKDPDDPSGFLSDVVQIASGDKHVCARKANGEVKCWGDNTNGQLGSGGYPNPGHALSVVAPEGAAGLLTGVVDLAVGLAHSCALVEGGSVVCWGHGHRGQLGRDLGPTSHESTHPLPVLDSGAPDGRFGGAQRLALGENHSCALLANGQVKCWGQNTQSELGNGDKGKHRSEPTLVPGLSEVTQISAYHNHVCARLSDGTAKCWGYAGSKAIGDGSELGSVDTPSFVLDPDDQASPLQGIDAIFATAFSTCAVLGTDLLCWGGNGSGELGDGTTTDRHFPTPVQW